MSALLQKTDRALQRVGTVMLLKRQTSAPGAIPVTTLNLSVRGRASDYTPQQLGGDIQQGDRHIIISNAEIAAASWPGPPRKGDMVDENGKIWRVIGCDTITINGEKIRHHITGRG